jgi:hypothetical protein
VKSFVGVVIACGCGATNASVPRVDVDTSDSRDASRDALIASADDAAKLEPLFRGSITNGGMWFSDPACMSQFGEPMVIPPADQQAFARCLAGLHLQPSKRADALGDVVVMEYAPGIEVEVRVLPELEGPHVSWIGFEARRADDPLAPTLTAATLESLRTAGDTNGPLDASVASTLKLDPTPQSHAQFAWFRLCLDDDGNISSLRHTETTSHEAAAIFQGAAQAWTFKPFIVDGKPMAACAMVRMAYPPDQAPAIETVPMPSPPKRDNMEPIVFAPGVRSAEAKRIAGQKQIYPDPTTMAAIARTKHAARGTFRACMSDRGDVVEVLPARSTGYAGYDAEIIHYMKRWKYSPFVIDGVAKPVCTLITFIYVH